MGLQLLAGPTGQPVSLDVAKKHLRIAPDDIDQDDEVGRLIRAATAHVEKITQRSLLSQSWRLVLDCFPPCALLIPRPPLVSVEAIAYTDVAGQEQLLDESTYLVNPYEMIGRVTPAQGRRWPATARQAMSLRVDFTAGYSTVPEDIVSAILLLVGHFDQNREAATAGALAEIPMGVEALLSPYCIPGMP